MLGSGHVYCGGCQRGCGTKKIIGRQIGVGHTSSTHIVYQLLHQSVSFSFQTFIPILTLPLERHHHRNLHPDEDCHQDKRDEKATMLNSHIRGLQHSYTSHYWRARSPI